MGKAWINFNIPKGESFTGRKWWTFAVFAAATAAAWNWSESIPVVGPYAGRAKSFVRKVLGGGRV